MKPADLFSIFRRHEQTLWPLYRELGRVRGDESAEPKWRERRSKELLAEIDRILEASNREVAAAAEEQRRALPKGGTKFTAEQIAETQLVLREYEDMIAVERRNKLPAAIAADLDAGDLDAARAKARAAQSLRVPLGDLAARLEDADPRLTEAREAEQMIDAAERMATVEGIRWKKSNGLPVSNRDDIALNLYMDEWKAYPGESFLDQARRPGRKPSSYEWKEPWDPELTRQREASHRARVGAAVIDPMDRHSRLSEAPGERDQED